MLANKEELIMRVQKANNEQAFGMAWKAKLKRMNVGEIRAIGNNIGLLDSHFGADLNAKIWKERYRSKRLGVDRAYYVFLITEPAKTFAEKMKKVFTGIIIRSESANIKGIDSEDQLSNIFSDAVHEARKKYLNDEGLIKRTEKEAKRAKRAEQKAATERAAYERQKATDELNLKVSNSNFGITTHIK